MTAPSLGQTVGSHPEQLLIDPQTLLETRLAMQANSGSGKSWALRRLLEQIYPSGIQQLILDPDDEFHTLREQNAYVLAGEGGDCPAGMRSAALLARRLLELGTSAVINIYELGARRADFVKAFLESMMAAPRSLWHPVFVVLDESHLFCPESGQGNASSTMAVIDLMSRGRKRGFCGILATQRIAKLNKNALAEVNNKLIGRAALDTDYKRAGAEIGKTSKEDYEAIRSMPSGEFFAFGPALYLKGRRGTHGVERIKVGDVSTTHLRAGQRSAPRPPPKDKIKSVLSELADLPHEAEEEAKDVAGLKTQVAELRKQLAAKPAAPVPALPKVETKFVERSSPAELLRIERLIAQGCKAALAIHDSGRDVGAAVERAEALGLTIDRELNKLREALAAAAAPPPSAHGMGTPLAPRLGKLSTATLASLGAPPAGPAAIGAQKHPPMRPVAAQSVPRGDRTPAQQRILDTLALLETYRIQSTREVLAAWLGVGPRQPAMHNNLGSLRTAGLVQGFGLTDAGRAAANVIRPPTQDEARASILSAVTPAQKRIVDVLLEAGRGLSREELAKALNVGERQPALHNNLGALRTRQLVTKGWPVEAGRVLFIGQA